MSVTTGFETLASLKERVCEHNTIDPSTYDDYDVKRGLRNKDGSGVLAGLTQISSVVGSKIVDGDVIPLDGVLRFRGLDVMDYMKRFTPDTRYGFETMVFLLLVGELPTDDELAQFSKVMAEERALPNDILEHIIKGVPGNDIMNKIQGSLAALYGFDSDPDSIDPYENFLKAVRIISKLPTIIAYSYLTAYVANPVYEQPRTDQSAAESFLTMLRQGQEPSKLEAHIMDLCLILHAEHGGGNNSTFTTYVVTSSNSDIYSTLAAATASLKGPLHGAANSKVMQMMTDIKDHLSSLKDKSELEGYVNKLLRKEAGDGSGKIYGLGHAVYTKSDPRAVIIKSYAEELAKDKGREDEYQLYLNLEEAGPRLFNEFKGSKKVISPNVDFFSGFVYDCLGIPQEIYTPIFAMARAAGWSAHRIEEILSGKRIIRPGYKYVGK